jgi:predicted nucleic acid-binding protein
VRTAVLDANVLYGAFSRDMLLRLAAARLYRPRWTARIQAEWTAALLAARPDLPSAQVTRTCAAMARAFPGAAVEGYEQHETGLSLPDPDDRHVLAAAVESEAGEIVTWNLADFPDDALRPLGVEAVSPDDFVLSLVEADRARVVATLRHHRAKLDRPPLTAPEYLGHLGRAGLVATADALGGEPL